MRKAEPSRRSRVVAALAAAALFPGIAAAQAQPPAAGPKPTLTFAEAVKRAMTLHPVTAQARADVSRAEAVVEEVRAAQLPFVNANASLTQLDGARRQGTAVVVPATSANANVQLGVPLVVPQRWAATDRARLGVNVAKGGEVETGRQIAFSAAQAFLTAVLQQRLLQNAERARDTARAHYDYSHQRLTHGVGNRLDEARAEKELHDDEARVATAQAALVRAEEALGVLTASDGPVSVKGDLELPGIPSAADALAAVDGRPDVALAQQRVSLAQKTLEDTRYEYFPTLSLAATPFANLPATVTAPTVGLQAQLLASIPLWDGGLRAGERREREALRDSARASLEALLRSGRSEVRASLDQLAQAERAQAEADTSAKLAAEVLKLATTAYDAGATSNLEVIDAERAARDAEASASLARDSTNQARLTVLVTSGRFPQQP